VASLTTEFS